MPRTPAHLRMGNCICPSLLEEESDCIKNEAESYHDSHKHGKQNVGTANVEHSPLIHPRAIFRIYAVGLFLEVVQ